MKFAIVLIVALVACGGRATADQAPGQPSTPVVSVGSSEPRTTLTTTSTTVSRVANTTSPTTEDLRATGPDAEFIEFEALWLCEAQRQTFDSPGAVDETLNSRLGEIGIIRADYDTFKAGLTENAVARKQILDLFVLNCS